MPAWLKKKRLGRDVGVGAAALMRSGCSVIMRRKSKAKTTMGVKQTPALEAAETGPLPTMEQMTRQIEAKWPDQAAEKARIGSGSADGAEAFRW